MEESSQFQGNYMETFNKEEHNKVFPGEVKEWKADANWLELTCSDTILRIEAISDDILRFRYANYRRFEEDFSYAVSGRENFSVNTFMVTEKKDRLGIETEKLKCWIYKENLHTTISDKNDFIIVEDELGYHWEENRAHGGNIVIKTHQIHSRESFYGLGDKSCPFNLRDQRLQLWGTDTYGYEAHSDPLYKNIPFFYGLHHKAGYGIFMDNTFQTFFDFGKERENVYSFWAQGGEMNFYFLYGPQLLHVAEQYARLTGTPELPPLWSLGYHQSKWSYYPERVVKKLANEFRKRKIPCDVIHLDIDYMDDYRCFTWDHQKFPDPQRLLGELADKGFKPIAIIDPGIKVDPDYHVYQQGIEKDFFCKRADGPLFRGSVWPGICHFPDFTSEEVRHWWADLVKGLVASGLHGLWNDMNEPAVFEEGTFPNDVRHHYEGYSCSHRKAHNIYGQQMAKATYEGVKRGRENKRPFTLTRSGYAGMQRYAAAWTGDNIASWDHLKIANIQCQRLAVSGVSFIGSDVGGFINEPTPELFARWIQLGIFHPFFRVHSSGDHGDQEPWTFGKETEKIVRDLIAFRYQLLPYLYTTFWQYVTAGTPMLKPLCFVYQDDFETIHRSEEFVLGDHLLVCPISRPGAEGEWVYIPDGEWFYFWNGRKFKGIGEEIWLENKGILPPFFVRAGAVIPLWPEQQYVGEKVIEEATLHAFASNNLVESIWYEDGGDGYEYREGVFLLRTFRISGTNTELSIEQVVNGNYQTPHQTFDMHVYGVEFKVKRCEVDGEEVAWQNQKETGAVHIKVASEFRSIKFMK